MNTKHMKLLYMKLTNFKGIKSFELRPNEKETFVDGRNGVGKSSILDAHLWLWFGKNAAGEATFNVKTLDKNNNPIHRLTHEVMEEFEFNGDTITMRRVLKEKWVTKRGEKEPIFDGHTTEYYWNDVPMNESQFNKQIASMIDGDLFPLLSNVMHFNVKLDWKQRRAILEGMAGNIDKIAVAKKIDGTNGISTAKIVEALEKKKTIEQFTDEVKNKISIIKKDLASFPGKIEEVNNMIPDFIDFDAVEAQIAEENDKLLLIEKQVADSSRIDEEYQNELSAMVNRVGEISRQLNAIEGKHKATMEYNAQQRKSGLEAIDSIIRSRNEELTRTETKLSSEKKRLEDLQAKKQKDIQAYFAEEQKPFVWNPEATKCPTCGRAYDNVADQEEARKVAESDFNQHKASKLGEMKEAGQHLTKQIQEQQETVNTVEKSFTELKDYISKQEDKKKTMLSGVGDLERADQESYKEALSSDREYQNLKAESIKLTAEIEEKRNAPRQDNTDSTLFDRKKEIKQNIDLLNQKLGKRGLREQIERRKEELISQESAQTNELMDLEGIYFSIQKFDEAMMDALQDAVNDKFRIVEFKMFERQINGGYKPTCMALIDGVPFSDANTASKINAGLDIICALSEYYQVSVPIFIDNRESVFNIIDTNTQVINLVAKEDVKTLQVRA